MHQTGVGGGGLARRISKLEQLVQLALGSSSSSQGGPTTFVVDPTQAIPSGNVFTTLLQAVTAAVGVAGKKQYLLRGAALTAAAGVYPFGNDPVTLSSQYDSTASFTTPSLTIAPGVTFTGDSRFTYEGLQVIGGALVAPVHTIGGSLNCGGIFFINGSGVQTTNAIPLIRAIAPATFGLVSLENCQGSGFFAAGGGSIVQASGAGAGLILRVGSGLVTADSIAQVGGGSALVQLMGPSSSVAIAQAGMPGGLLESGTNLSYIGSVDLLGGVEPVAIADAAATTIRLDQGKFRTVTANGQNSVLTLSNTGANGGAFVFCDDLIVVTKRTKEAFTYRINRADGTALVTIPALSAGAFVFQFDGANWFLREGGTWL